MRNVWRALACVLFASAAAPCSADIYLFVDEHGRSNFSDVKIDDRYALYMNVSPQPNRTVSPDIVAPHAASPAPSSTTGVYPLKARHRYNEMIHRVAHEQKVDPALIHAVVSAESAYNERARSRKGARGLMQVMPGTAKRFGIRDYLNPVQNLRAGTRYLSHLLATYSNLELAIAAYNAGEGAVARYGNSIPPYPETRAYVPKVLEYYERYRTRV